MKTFKTLSVGLALGVAAWASPAHAQGAGGLTPSVDNPPTRQGTRGATFLHLLVGARNNSMGGAVGTSVTGPEAWLINPAGAAATEGFSVAGGRQNLYGDLGISQNYAALSLPLVGGVVGFSLNALSSGDLQRTTIGDNGRPNGDERSGTSFDWTSIAATAGYARRITDRLSIGAQAKYITEGITNASTSWLAFDAGTQFQTGIYGLVLSGALSNIGGSARATGPLIDQTVTSNAFSLGNQDVSLRTVDTDLPTAFRFSVGDNLLGNAESLFGNGGGKHSLTAEVAMNDAVDLAAQVAVGAEYGFRNVLFVRGGKRFYNDDRATSGNGSYGLSGGFGVRVPVQSRSLRFDYSYTGLGDLRNIQVFSLQLSR